MYLVKRDLRFHPQRIQAVLMISLAILTTATHHSLDFSLVLPVHFAASLCGKDK